MVSVLPVDQKCLAFGAVAATTAIALVSSYKYLALKRALQKDKDIYENKQTLNEYLFFHYGKPDEVLRWRFGPTGCMDFPSKCADVCKEHFTPTNVSTVTQFYQLD